MISGAHVVLYSTDAAADRAFIRDVLGFHHVDAGEGWLIFRLPPSEFAVHPVHPPDTEPSDTDAGGRRGMLRAELYLLCEDVEATRTALEGAGAQTSDVVDAGWGLLTSVRLPGGGALGVYEPRHSMAVSTNGRTE